MAQGTKDYSVPALEKSIMILNALAEAELSTSDLHLQLKLPKSTTFVILNTLEQHAIIQKSPEGKYRLGHGVLRWGMSYFKSMDVVRIARPLLERLVSGTPFTAHLAAPVDNKPVYVDKVEGGGFVRFATAIGQTQPLFRSAVGKAMASDWTEEQLRGFLVEEAQGAADPGKIERELAKMREDAQFVREHGFVVEDEEFEEGVRCVGAPIRGANGGIVASLSITALIKDLPVVKFIAVGNAVKDTAGQISRELGYRGGVSDV
ncbi:MAG: IclR family transcriptional regulator [Paenibacillaceae bacterium]|nr:IclR family transcriptional regulator [Paenibacillaceae bacterium]